MPEPPVQADQSAVERVRNIALIIHITFLGALTRGSFVNYTTDAETTSAADCSHNSVFVHFLVRGTHPRNTTQR
jgi:hypothetical protein